MGKIIEGWVVWDAENWVADYRNIYPDKEYALEAAKKHFSYQGEEVDEDCIRKVKFNLWGIILIFLNGSFTTPN